MCQTAAEVQGLLLSPILDESKQVDQGSQIIEFLNDG